MDDIMQENSILFTTNPLRDALAAMFDQGQAALFIKELGLTDVVFQRFPVRERDSSSFAQSQMGTLDQCLRWVKISNIDQLATVAIMTNPSRGPKQSDVQEVRNVFADDDVQRNEYRIDWALPPHIIIETSPGKFHYFWGTESGCITPKELGKLQGMIAIQYGTDKSLSDYAKKARLPGTVHLKGEPFTTRIVAVNRHPRFNREQLEEAFGNFNSPTTPKTRQGIVCTAVFSNGPIQEGSRNTTLFKIGASAVGQGIVQEDVTALLHKENMARCNPPLDEAEVDSIISSVCQYPPNPKRYPLTDAGNSERFAAMMANKLCFNYTSNQWNSFSHGIWRPDMNGTVDRSAVEVVRSIIKEAAEIDDEKVRNAMLSWAKKSESLKARRAMIEGAKALLAVDHSLFDSDRWKINLNNGYLDLRTGNLLAHNPTHYVTKIAGCGYNPTAKASIWERFIGDLTCGDPELADYLQKQIGRYLTGDISEQTLLFLFGRGANGKSVLATVLTKLLGNYAVTMRPDFLLDSAKNAELEALELRGARLAICHELPENGKLAENRLKTLTGGDLIKGRGLYQNFQTFEPTAKYLLLGNHKPYVPSGGDAIWRRLRLFPCDFIATPETIDPKLTEKLIAELSGILNWALAGLQRWLTEGETLPSRMIEELKDYREAEDGLGAFLAETCDFNNNFTVDKSELYGVYKDWANEAGEFVLSQKALTKKLSERGIRSSRNAAARQYVGIGLKCPPRGGIFA